MKKKKTPPVSPVTVRQRPAGLRQVKEIRAVAGQSSSPESHFASKNYNQKL